MVNCSQCKEEISNEAKVCPKCGHPQFEFGFLISLIYSVSAGGVVLYIMRGVLELQTNFNLIIPIIVIGYIYGTLRSIRK